MKTVLRMMMMGLALAFAPLRATVEQGPAVLPGLAVGDRVLLIDGAGVEFVATLTGYDAETGQVRVAIDEEPWTFPAEHVQGKAGWWDRLKAFYTYDSTRGSAAVRTAVGVAATALGAVALDEVEVSADDGEERVPADEAEAAARAAEQRALVNGSSAPVRFVIAGTFRAAPVPTATGPWTPAITFGPPEDGFRGGEVAGVSAPPPVPGDPEQAVSGGGWVQTGADTLYLSGTLDRYAGAWTVQGGDLLRAGVLYTGGTVTRHAAEAAP